MGLTGHRVGPGAAVELLQQLKQWHLRDHQSSLGVAEERASGDVQAQIGERHLCGGPHPLALQCFSGTQLGGGVLSSQFLCTTHKALRQRGHFNNTLKWFVNYRTRLVRSRIGPHRLAAAGSAGIIITHSRGSDGSIGSLAQAPVKGAQQPHKQVQALGALTQREALLRLHRQLLHQLLGRHRALEVLSGPHLAQSQTELVCDGTLGQSIVIVLQPVVAEGCHVRKRVK
mmetsp:Transcript_7969/g.13444  ORF Transcript_7969/g.13444 Transcript_7969/m.13444 type:complete len:229 (-) Transcript_7969:550-1236(-)